MNDNTFDRLDLKPCPFCGSPAHIEKTKVRLLKGKVKSRRTHKTNLFYVIGCTDPDCILYCTKQHSSFLFQVSADGLNTMVRRWNRRAT